MTTNPDLENLREARAIISGLYSTAHSLACNDPDCPQAQLFNEHSETGNARTSPREDALLVVVLAIVENIGECIDLVRMLVANRDEASRLSHLTQSSTTSRSSTEDTGVNSPESLDEAPIPSLYRDQWTQTPAFSPPAYTAYFHDHPRGFPRAPAPSPAASQSTTPSAGSTMTADQEYISCGDQGQQDRARMSAEPGSFRAEDP